ncbi:unnamed protein product [Mytilus coruscus]|uniref:Uncharacterized protein n=1 Tax=Mytilus coruscus TaxID=42192 RepID=A0A6J8A089_MYTCO|nr:unnamed protein product [Mytilus coruscus]
MPYKHFLAVFKHSDISFNFLPERYKNHAVFIVDTACLGVYLSSLGCKDRTATPIDTEENEEQKEEIEDISVNQNVSESSAVTPKILREVAKQITTLCYIIDNTEVLQTEKAIQIAQAFEYSQEQLKEMKNFEPSTVVHEVTISRHTQYNSASSRKNRQTSDRTRTGPVNQDRVKVEPHRFSSQQGCGNCGRRHSKQEECPAKGKSATVAKKWNHFCTSMQIQTKGR